MSDVLARICADKRAYVAERKVAVAETDLRRAAGAAPPCRGFEATLRAARAAGRVGLIAEIKRASPSGGLIRADFDPKDLGRAYAAGGASCLSVLTDRPYFQGADEYLTAARAAAGLPVLRKDFMLDPYQIIEARAIGADCVLLILAAIDDATARDLGAAAHELGMDVLVEVHDEVELERAIGLGETLIGINNRNLATLTVDLATCERLVRRLPADRLVVGESGIRSPADIARLRAAGIDCFLVGEHLMREADVTAATRALIAGA